MSSKKVNMNKPWNVIAELESDNSRLFKEAVVAREVKASNTEFFEGCRLALDSMITFGLKQIKEKTDADGPGLDWASFNNAAQLFINRACTGNSARDVVAQLTARATKEQWNGWYRRILIKDLRCGVSETTINKMAKGHDEFSVPVFSCQLAHDSANHESKVSGRKLIEVKLDGVRVITIVYPSGRVDQFSRNGKELVNFPHVKEQIAEIAHSFTEPMVLDGEIMSSSFQDLMKQVHRKSNVKANDAVLNLFDVLPLADFEAGRCKTTQIKRSEYLQKWFAAHEESLPNVTVLEHESVDLDTVAGQKRFKEINALAIAGGYEGIMIKEPNAVYECKRTVSWLKLKPFIEVTLTAVAVEEGTGKNVGRMGAVLFEGTDDGKFIRVSVGSGWSDKDRDDIWRSRKAVLGQQGEVRADAVTQSQDNDTVFSMRFPRFKVWRGFVAGEKL
jgi:DNA ligase-1